MYNEKNLATVKGFLTNPWYGILLLLSFIIVWQMPGSKSASAHAATQYQPVTAARVAAIQVPVAIKRPKPRFLQLVSTNDKVEYNSKDLFCLAKNIYHEAGSEPILGRYAVAQVTLNRMGSDKYPHTVCGVVLENRQFSWANNHRKRWSTPHGEAWEESKRIAKDVLENGKRIYGMADVLYYHANYVRPQWSHRKIRLAQIGLHIFYQA
jgi:spore germination cell wall hydrolase CwlJ-like protein